MSAYDLFSFAEKQARRAPDALAPIPAAPIKVPIAVKTDGASTRGTKAAAGDTESGAPQARPGVTGDPLDLSTDPTVPKPLSAIEVIEPDSGLRLEDRKLFNLLLALSWDRLTERRSEKPFSAPAADLRRSMGQATRNDNRRLRESLKRLMRTLVTFPRLMEDGRTNEAIAPLLAFGSIPKGAGLVEWDFHELIRPHLAAPCIWARLHLEICAAFRSKYGLILYEVLSLRAGRQWPIWTVPVDELRRYMGVADRLEGWGSLERRVIAPAVAEVNRLARFRAEYSVERARSSRRVETVRFRVLRSEKEAT
jgi:hypothetical protein